MSGRCVICLDKDGRNIPATRICNELNRPVCDQHAVWCDREGHGSRVLDEDGKESA